MFVYLLTPTSPKAAFLKKSYVGFTTNLQRRVRQHNGEIKGGAKKTSKYSKWKVVCCLSGFPTKVDALKFEWMWQHPLKSKLSRELVRQKVVRVGSVGTVKRKVVEMTWLMGLVGGLTININPKLFNVKSMKGFCGKLGVDMQKLNLQEAAKNKSL